MNRTVHCVGFRIVECTKNHSCNKYHIIMKSTQAIDMLMLVTDAE